VRKHLPITTKRFRRNAGTECRYIALKVCLNKGCAPRKAGVVRGGQKTVWKAATSSEAVRWRALNFGDFRDRKRREFLICNTSGKAFGGLLQQIHRSRAE
jgi:hypothetical protein